MVVIYSLLDTSYKIQIGRIVDSTPAITKKSKNRTALTKATFTFKFSSEDVYRSR